MPPFQSNGKKKTPKQTSGWNPSTPLPPDHPAAQMFERLAPFDTPSHSASMSSSGGASSPGHSIPSPSLEKALPGLSLSQSKGFPTTGNASYYSLFEPCVSHMPRPISPPATTPLSSNNLPWSDNSPNYSSFDFSNLYNERRSSWVSRGERRNSLFYDTTISPTEPDYSDGLQQHTFVQNRAPGTSGNTAKLRSASHGSPHPLESMLKPRFSPFGQPHSVELRRTSYSGPTLPASSQASHHDVSPPPVLKLHPLYTNLVPPTPTLTLSSSGSPVSASSESPVASPPRNPRMQPATSNYALWVGNLPQRSTLLELCWLFGSPEMISIYLIHRTGCAFVNYQTEESLEAATMAFHDRGGKIRDHKLVIKAQKKSQAVKHVEEVVQSPAHGSKNRYFICKSLTVTDLEKARDTLLWSTQEHNRTKFNDAFTTSENVYFIFSANRNSAFFGYARMESLIPEGEKVRDNEEVPADDQTEEARIEFVPAYNGSDGVSYPAGRIVEDPGTGCLFWETLDYQDEQQKVSEIDHWTAPCAIKWMSSADSQIPFTRTRHMRNPLNSNKPVKIARDGTELEPSLGRQLCSLFSKS